jgi:hypothetical protein
MQEAKNSVLQEVASRTLLVLCFVYHINSAGASVVTRMRIDLESEAPTRPIGHPPSYGKDQLPNSEQKTSQINLVLVKYKQKFQEYNPIS